jgi:hypothetical protein
MLPMQTSQCQLQYFRQNLALHFSKCIRKAALQIENSKFNPHAELAPSASQSNNSLHTIFIFFTSQSSTLLPAYFYQKKSWHCF